MMAGAQQLENKIDGFLSLLFTGRRQQAFWFWFVGLGIVIPTITYISATLIGFVLVSILDLAGISGVSDIRPIALGLDGVCGATSLFGYYKLWIIYKEKWRNKLHPK